MARFDKPVDYTHDCLLSGTTLDELPKHSRNRVLRLAKSNGFVEAHWCSRKNLTLLVRAARRARDQMLKEGLVNGLDETDAFMHRMCSWLGLTLAELKT